MRKLSFPPTRAHSRPTHTERDERRAAARANGVDVGATSPPGIRRKPPRRSERAAAPRTAPNGVEPFRDLHSIWSAEGSQGTNTISTHRPRAATVKPQVAPSGRAGIDQDCPRPRQPARRGLTCDVQACGRVSRGGGGKRPRRAVAPCARSAGKLNGGTRASWTQKMRVHAARAAVAAAEACSADAEAPRRAAPAPAEPMRQRVEKAGAHRRGDAGGPESRCREGARG